METKANGYVHGSKNELIEMLEVVVLPEILESISNVSIKYYKEFGNLIHKLIHLKLFPLVLFTINMSQLLTTTLYPKGFLNRTNLCVDDTVLKLKEWKNRIRSCYAGLVSFESNVS